VLESILKIVFELSVQIDVIEYVTPLEGIFEEIEIKIGSVSETLNLPVSRLVVNIIGSSAAVVFVVLSTFLQENKKRHKIGISIFILVFFDYSI
jgi:hypothetical protein